MDWYFAPRGECLGPVTDEAAAALVTSGEITSATLVWREGCDGWVPAWKTSLFQAAASVPPTNAPPVRSVAKVVVLTALTFGFYQLFLTSRWSREVNAVLGRRKYRPARMVLLHIITLGLASYVLEIMWANDLQKSGERLRLSGRYTTLRAAVVVLIGVSLLADVFHNGILNATLGPAAALFVLALLQHELNKFASPSEADRSAVTE